MRTPEDNVDYECDLLADDELFIRLQSDETLFDDLEELTADQVSKKKRYPKERHILTIS